MNRDSDEPTASFPGLSVHIANGGSGIDRQRAMVSIRACPECHERNLYIKFADRLPGPRTFWIRVIPVLIPISI